MTTDPPLQPIMQKPGQAPPLASRALSPLRINSPKFADLSPSQASAERTSYFSPSVVSPRSTTPSGILLNKLKLDGTEVSPPASPSDEQGPAGPTTAVSDPVAPSGIALGLGVVGGGFARVGSPDGSASETASSEGWASSTAGGGGSVSTAPSSAVGSPAIKARARSPTDSLATLTFAANNGMPILADEGAGLSRSPSPHCHFAPLPNVDQERPPTRRSSNAAPPQKLKMSSAADAPDEPFVFDSDEAKTTSSDPQSLTGLSALSFATGVPPPRQLSFSRSSSPSPPRRSSSVQSSSRSHSPPPMARKGSNDALHLHYIDAEGSAGRRPASSVGSNNGRSRDGSLERSDDGGAGGAAISRTGSRRSTFSSEPVVSGRCKPVVRSRSSEGAAVNEEVVEVPPTEGVAEGEGDISEEEDEEDVGDEEDDEEDGEDEEDEEEEDGEDGEEGDDAHDGDEEGDDEEEEEDEGDATPAKASATVRGAAVEVVHWHKREETQSQVPAPAPTQPQLQPKEALATATATL